MFLTLSSVHFIGSKWCSFESKSNAFCFNVDVIWCNLTRTRDLQNWEKNWALPFSSQESCFISWRSHLIILALNFSVFEDPSSASNRPVLFQLSFQSHYTVYVASKPSLNEERNERLAHEICVLWVIDPVLEACNMSWLTNLINKQTSELTNGMTKLNKSRSEKEWTPISVAVPLSWVAATTRTHFACRLSLGLSVNLSLSLCPSFILNLLLVLAVGVGWSCVIETLWDADGCISHILAVFFLLLTKRNWPQRVVEKRASEDITPHSSSTETQVSLRSEAPVAGPHHEPDASSPQSIRSHPVTSVLPRTLKVFPMAFQVVLPIETWYTSVVCPVLSTCPFHLVDQLVWCSSTSVRSTQFESRLGNWKFWLRVLWLSLLTPGEFRLFIVCSWDSIVK